MLDLLGYLIPLPGGLNFLAAPPAAFVINLAAWALILLLTNFIVLRVLKFAARRMPGDLEDILVGIVNHPLLILLALFGVNDALRHLPLLPAAQGWVQKISLTLLILVLTHIVGRFIEDVLVYNGEKWAARTETRIDDVLVPVLHLFGPPLLILIAALLILPLWGINVTSVLLGAGVLGLVLGLALQETLGNIFSGLSLLIEAPFRKGDLILLPDGRTCEVLHLGMRSTRLFSLDEQATIYLPNKTLASNMLVNLTRPTPEQRCCIELRVEPGRDLAQVQAALLEIANGHPAVLSADMDAKLPVVRRQADRLKDRAAGLPPQNPAAARLAAEAGKNEGALEKLALEGQFNARLADLMEALRNLYRGIHAREGSGLSQAERQELYCNFISPVDAAVQTTAQAGQAWSEARDPWASDEDYWVQRKLWAGRNEQLALHWERLKKSLYQTDDRRETRLDDSVTLMLDWIEKEYRLAPGYWKNPGVVIKALDSADSYAALLQLCYYVDNIRLERDGRAARVRTELSRMIREELQTAG